MIRVRAILFVLGQFVAIFAGTMAVPLAYGWYAGDEHAISLLWSMSIAGASGAALIRGGRRPERELSQREGLLLVVGTWAAICGFGSLPFVLCGEFPTFTDAVFESVSGFTATGATILADVETLTPAVQFWRCFMHWLGGLGIVLLGVAVLPLVGHGGMHLYRAEFSGAKSEKLKPRIAETAKALWRIYLAMSIVLYALLRLAGMDNFDALCHTFSIGGTGGFSSRTASLAAFDSPAIHYIAVVFMLLGGISFVQHYRFWIEGAPGRVVRDVEIRAYLALAAVASLIVAGILWGAHGYGWERGFRSALFEVVATMTTTGLVIDDYESWHPLPQLMLLSIMFVGGCTGSTSGGLKVARILLLARVVDREFKRMVERRGVFAVRLGGQVIPEQTVQSLLNLVYLAFFVNFASCLALAAMGVDVFTSIAAVAASMFNIGPGLGGVGPLSNYGGLPAAAKWVLCVDMVAGRLEFYTLLVILTPPFWRR